MGAKLGWPLTGSKSYLEMSSSAWLASDPDYANEILYKYISKFRHFHLGKMQLQKISRKMEAILCWAQC